MSEFGRLRKHEKTQHALVGLGSAALAAAVVLPRYDDPNFPKDMIKCSKHKTKKHPQVSRKQNSGFRSMVLW